MEHDDILVFKLQIRGAKFAHVSQQGIPSLFWKLGQHQLVTNFSTFSAHRGLLCSRSSSSSSSLGFPVVACGADHWQGLSQGCEKCSAQIKYTSPAEFQIELQGICFQPTTSHVKSRLSVQASHCFLTTRSILPMPTPKPAGSWKRSSRPCLAAIFAKLGLQCARPRIAQLRTRGRL